MTIDPGFIERALVAGTVAGVLDRIREDTVDRVIVALDDETLDAAIDRARDAAMLAVVVASAAAASFVALARKDAALVEAARSKKDGHARALVWASSVRGPIAPAVSAERIVTIVDRACAAGLALVEVDRSPVLPALGRLRLGSTATDRAVATIEVTGAIAHPLVFVAETRAPKGAPKLRTDRLESSWVGPGESVDDDADDAIEEAALDVLESRDAPVRFKELLREVRTKIKASTEDSRRLAKAIYRASLHGRIELFMREP
jgi:hypothetical protein